MMSTIDERVTDEVEALKAILLDDELKISTNEKGEPTSLEIQIFPSTGEDLESKYVCIKLIVTLTPGYPDVPPTINFQNPRGLDESTVKQIQLDAQQKCKDFVGPVVFELIELVRDHLTKSNLPTGQCVICLYGFQQEDAFVKTDCFHYFHSHCLAVHVKVSEKYYREEQANLPQWQQDKTNKFKAYCPVCREPISIDVKNLSKAAPPIELENAIDFSITDDLKKMQNEMKKLFLNQQENGGIIDIAAEELKFLVTTDDSNDQSIPGTSLNSNVNEIVSNNHLVQNHNQVRHRQDEQRHDNRDRRNRNRSKNRDYSNQYDRRRKDDNR